MDRNETKANRGKQIPSWRAKEVSESSEDVRGLRLSSRNDCGVPDIVVYRRMNEAA